MTRAVLPRRGARSPFAKAHINLGFAFEVAGNGAAAIGSYEQPLASEPAIPPLVSLMDPIISVDTSVAHLAGALGKPVWILLPFAPERGWLLEREDSPWYPSARLFRQPRIGDWDSVVNTLMHRLMPLRQSV
jgi:hypothetical protein